MESAKEERERAKLEARAARNEAQAIEERNIWQAINAKADQAVITYKAKVGRNSTYTQEIGEEIITRLSEGQSLSSICKLEHMPHIATIYDWIAKHPSFGEGYSHARENAAHTLFDQMLDIADDCSADLLDDGTPNNAAIARAKVRIDTRARVAGKLHARAYGERIEQLNQTVNVTNNSLTVSGADLSADQRSALRSMLLQARDSKVIDG